jgi:putative nucleotide binding protein
MFFKKIVLDIYYIKVIKMEEKKEFAPKTEERAIILDYMPSGKSSAIKTEPVAQAIGKTYFTLLELTPKVGKGFSVGEEVYVGKEDRDKVELIKGRIEFKDLTSNSLAELNDTIEDMVDAEKEKFLNFYNISRPISLKRHQLELLPGIGKKHVKDILDERNKKKFESFEEIVERVKNVPAPKKAIVKRIMEELEGPEDKHYLFVRPPSAPKRFDRYPPRKRF